MTVVRRDVLEPGDELPCDRDDIIDTDILSRRDSAARGSSLAVWWAD